MGSRSDLEVMREALDTMKEFGVEHELTVVSAHRTPDRMFAYAKGAADRGIKVIIAGAGGAAHLPGMVASLTILPVIGVPIKSRNSIDGWDSLLSIVQMPSGVPVATVAVKEFLFKQPVSIGDLLSFYSQVTRVGRTSITVQVEVVAERNPANPEVVKVTEAQLTYVAIDHEGKPRAFTQIS